MIIGLTCGSTVVFYGATRRKSKNNKIYCTCEFSTLMKVEGITNPITMDEFM